MENKSGGVLLSHAVARVVSSARQGLTTEFGMDRVWPLRYELSAFSYQRSAKRRDALRFPALRAVPIFSPIFSISSSSFV